MSERALVLCDEIGIFLAVARSLGRRGIEVDAVAYDPDAPGLASRYIDRRHQLPAYRSGPEDWTEALRALAEAEDYRLIVPCSDSDLTLLHHHADELGRERLAIPNDGAFRAFTDKAATKDLAKQAGVPVADGVRLSADPDPDALIERLGLPMVLKPRSSYRLGASETKCFARIAEDRRQLDQALAAVGESWLAEAFFAGDGVGLSVLAEKGEIRLAWQHRRLRQVSATGASSARSGEPVDPRLMKDVEALARAVELSGVAMFEFRQDQASGRHVLLEVNPRFWGSLPLALAAGADFPALLWDLHKGAAPVPGAVRREGVTKVSMTGECDRAAGMAEGASSPGRKAMALAAILSFTASLPFRRRFDSWAADDPAPYLVERRQVIQRLGGGLAKKLPKRLMSKSDRPKATIPAPR